MLLLAGTKKPTYGKRELRELNSALEAVSADRFLFPSYLIGKGDTHIFDWYKHVCIIFYLLSRYMRPVRAMSAAEPLPK